VTKEGVTLSISDFPDRSTKDGLDVRKIPADQPLEFTVTLKNDSKEAVEGDLTVWLNDDWTVRDAQKAVITDDSGKPVKGDNMTVVVGFAPVRESQKIKVSLEPGQSTSIPFVAVAKQERVLSALYPIHARFTPGRGGETLHPIAIFEAVGSASPPRAAVPGGDAGRNPATVGDGVLRLDGTGWRTGFSQKGESVDLGFDFSGLHSASGTDSRSGANTRGGIQRGGFGVHPPWRGGPGTTWMDFDLALPAGKPATLKFHTAIRDSHPN
jgi:hypothetical protein